MVLTAAQITALFKDASPMGFSNRTRFHSLNAEGITLVNDLAKWEDGDWNQLMSNCKNPDKIPDPINAAQLIHQAPFPLLVKSLKRLNIASRMFCYYDSISVDLTVPNLHWTVLDNFEIQRKVMATKFKQLSPNVPKLGNNTNVAKWNDYIIVHAGQVFGARNYTIEYLLRANAAVMAPHPPLLVNRFAPTGRR